MSYKGKDMSFRLINCDATIMTKCKNNSFRPFRTIVNRDYYLRHASLSVIRARKQLGSYWTDFDETSYLSSFSENMSKKFRFH